MVLWHGPFHSEIFENQFKFSESNGSYGLTETKIRAIWLKNLRPSLFESHQPTVSNYESLPSEESLGSEESISSMSNESLDSQVSIGSGEFL